jgi:hypothetical protein
VKALRQFSGKSLAETLSPVLNEVWEKRLRQKIKADLQIISQKHPDRAPPATGGDSHF